MYARTFSFVRPLVVATSALLLLGSASNAIPRLPFPGGHGPRTIDPPPVHIIPPLGTLPILLTPLQDLISQQAYLPVATPGDVDGPPQTVNLFGLQFKNTPVTETVNITELSAIGANTKLADLGSKADVLWPGALVQGNSLLNGTLSLVDLARAPGTLSLTPLGGQPRSLSVAVPGADSIRGARLDLLQGTTFAPVPLSVEYHRFYSLNDAMFKVGARSSSLTNSDLLNQLEVSVHAHPNHLLVVFRQPYYTLTMAPPATSSSYFADSITDADLRPYTDPNNSNPTLYISSVTYGRTGLLFFSSDQSYQALKQSVQTALNTHGIGALIHTGVSELAKHSDIKLVMLYGNPDIAVNFANGADAVGKMMDWRSQTVTPSDIQLGMLPISYRVNYLKDNSPATISYTAHYTRREQLAASQPITSLPTTGAHYTDWKIAFDTTDDDKDGDTALTVQVVGQDNTVIAHYNGLGGQNGAQYTYDNGSHNELLLTQDANLNVQNVRGAHLRIRIDPNGNDKWVFNYTLTAKNTDGGPNLVKSGHCTLVRAAFSYQEEVIPLP